MLPSLVRFPARPPRHAHFGIRSIDPMHLLSTLQTPRYRDACKTRCWSVCSTLTRPDFHRQADTSFPNAHRTGLLPCVMTANITDEDGCTMWARGIHCWIKPVHPLPPHQAFLTTSGQRSVPVSAHFVAKPCTGPEIARNAVVLAVATYYRSQPLAHFWDWIVPASLQLGFHLFELGPQAICRCLPMHQELSRPGPPTAVAEPKELEGLRFPLSSLLSVLGGISPKLQQARLVRVQRQANVPQPLPQDDQELLGVCAVLEPHDEVVQVTHDDHVTTRFSPAPSLGPQIEHLVHIQIGRQRCTNH